MISIICAYGPESGRPDAEKVRFCYVMTSEWNLGSYTEVNVSLGNCNERVERCVEDFKDVR